MVVWLLWRIGQIFFHEDRDELIIEDVSILFTKAEGYHILFFNGEFSFFLDLMYCQKTLGFSWFSLSIEATWLSWARLQVSWAWRLMASYLSQSCWELRLLGTLKPALLLTGNAAWHLWLPMACSDKLYSFVWPVLLVWKIPKWLQKLKKTKKIFGPFNYKLMLL